MRLLRALRALAMTKKGAMTPTLSLRAVFFRHCEHFLFRHCERFFSVIASQRRSNLFFFRDSLWDCYARLRRPRNDKKRHNDKNKGKDKRKRAWTPTLSLRAVFSVIASQRRSNLFFFRGSLFFYRKQSPFHLW